MAILQPAAIVPVILDRNKKQFDHFGNRLDIIHWQNQEIVPVRKNFKFQHPNLEAMTPEDCQMLRAKHGIFVENEDVIDVPKPVRCLEETPFPDWAPTVLRQRLWTEPTPIQMQGWPVALHGHDLIGIAATGSGKTMAYVLPMLVHIMAQPELKPGEGPVGLVLVPTGELCKQVAKEIQAFEVYTGLVCRAVCGGDDQGEQRRAFLERVDIIVATPGRLIHMLNERHTNLLRATFVVLDEADLLLSEGFGEQVRLVLTQVRPDRQVLLFTATWEDNIEHFARETCKCDPIQVNCAGTKLSACKDVEQTFWCRDRVGDLWPPAEGKMQVLHRAITKILPQLERGDKALIFCNRRETVREVVEELQARDITCEGFAADYSLDDRRAALERFMDPDAHLPLLVCTQVLGRGSDFQRVRFVINYDMPSHLVDYVHRIGRTGRAGNKGTSLTLLEETDLWLGREIIQCIEGVDQVPPTWLRLETSKKKLEKWRRLHRDEKAKALCGGQPCNGGALPPPSEPVHGTDWNGRGRGRRDEFLAQCGGLGAARVAQSCEAPRCH